jgi:hypothetical protein
MIVDFLYTCAYAFLKTELYVDLDAFNKKSIATNKSIAGRPVLRL